MSVPQYEGTSPLVSDRFVLTFQAGEDLSDAIGYVVELTGDMIVKKTASSTASAKVMGITMTKAVNGAKVTVVARGVCRAKAYGNISAGDQVASYTTGRIQTYTTKDTCAIGNALQAITSGGTGLVALW